MTFVFEKFQIVVLSELFRRGGGSIILSDRQPVVDEVLNILAKVKVQIQEQM